MTPENLAQAIAEGRPLVIVDARSPERFRDGHIPNATNLPSSELENRVNELDHAAPTVCY